MTRIESMACDAFAVLLLIAALSFLIGAVLGLLRIGNVKLNMLIWWSISLVSFGFAGVIAAILGIGGR